MKAYADLPLFLKHNWTWWNVPAAPVGRQSLLDLIDTESTEIEWHSEAETMRLLSMMSPQNLAKVRQAQFMQDLQIGTIYKRTRTQDGKNPARRSSL